MLQSHPPSRRGRYLGVLICMSLGIAVGVWHNQRERSGRGDPVSSAVGSVSAPIVTALVGAQRWIGRQTGWLVRGRTADDENRHLRESVRRLREEVASLKEQAATAHRLRKQLGFPQQDPSPKLAATVIAFRPDPQFDTMVIARGSTDGVHVGSVVVAPEGLVGHVYSIGRSSANVLLLTDSNSAVGAMIQRPESRATGVARGDRKGQMALAYIPRDADVKAGDAVVTSGLGGDKGVFPKGLPIGSVTHIGTAGASAMLPVTVRPSAPFGRLEEVYVLR